MARLTPKEYADAVNEIRRLMAVDPPSDSPDGVRLRELAALASAYEIFDPNGALAGHAPGVQPTVRGLYPIRVPDGFRGGTTLGSHVCAPGRGGT